MNTPEKMKEWAEFLEKITGIPQMVPLNEVGLSMAIAELVTFYPEEKPLLKQACSQLRILRK